MAIQIKKVISPAHLQTFIELPYKLHKAQENWMPTMITDDKKFFNPEKNHQFDSCDTVLALAYKDDKVAGRIMGIIHNTYNALRGENNARFGYIDAIDDQQVVHELIAYISDWAKQKGKEKLVGPYGFSDKDVQGLLIEGFDKKPLIDSACNPAYIVKLIEKEGFLKDIDCYTYKFPSNMHFPELYYKIRDRAIKNQSVVLHNFTSRSELKKYIVPVLQLVNTTYNELYGFVPMTDTEIQELAGRYLPILDPRFVKVVTKADEVVGFIVGIPNLTDGMIKAKGRLFPFGVFKILWEMKRTKQLDLMLGAVHRQYQSLGLEVVLGLSLIDAAKNAGMEQIETHLILENNVKMRAEMERVNIPIYKRFRVYQKLI